MSLQPLPWRRSAAHQRPNQHIKNQQTSKGKQQSPSHKDKNTRRKRILDLLRHIPTFTMRFLRLMAFVLFLLPAFVVFVWHYLTCDRIAAYYGKSQFCNDEESYAKGHEQVGKNGLDNTSKKDISNRDRNHKNCKDPFFSRHYLDIYGSKTPSPDQYKDTNKKPVVIFLTGGAWIIGYRMWGCLLGRALAPFGILVMVPDYRNFPRVNIEGMVQDVDRSIQWVFDHAEEYGGDKEKVVLVGQSAGAHIGGVVVAMKVLDWLRRERRLVEQEADNLQNESREELSPSLKSEYSPQQLCGFISTSSPHNLVTMSRVFHHHGLSSNVQKSIFGGLVGDDQNNSRGEDVFEKWSPYHLVMKSHLEYVNLMELSGKKSNARLELKDVFPRLCVIHGTADKTVSFFLLYTFTCLIFLWANPYTKNHVCAGKITNQVPVSEAIEFISLLTKLKIPTETKMYQGWTHTDPILEAPMRGNHTYHRDIYHLVSLWTGSVYSSSYLHGDQTGHMNIKTMDERHPMLQPICPSVLVEAARFCNPF